jgi:hypothetical protein
MYGRKFFLTDEFQKIKKNMKNYSKPIQQDQTWTELSTLEETAWVQNTYHVV